MQILFLKATVLREVVIPGYTRDDGTYIQEHRRKVHINPDVSKEEVLNGRGSASQRHAHGRLTRESYFNRMDPHSQHMHILAHATDHQLAASAARDLLNWRKAAMDGRNPTAGLWRAFNALSPEKQRTEIAAVERSVGSTHHLSSLARGAAADFHPASPVVEAPAIHAAREVTQVSDPETPEPVALTESRIYQLPNTDGVFKRRSDGTWFNSQAEEGMSWFLVGNNHYASRLERLYLLDNPSAGQSATEPLHEVNLNGLHLTRRADGSWFSLAGDHREITHGEGSPTVIAANILARVPMSDDQINAHSSFARIHALEKLHYNGMDIDTGLNNLFPVGGVLGVHEGDTKLVNGVMYVLQDGRWHRQSVDESLQQASAPEAAEHPAVALTSADLIGTHMTFTEGTSNKFWTSAVDGNRLITHYGRIGASGTVSVAHFESEAAALRAQAIKLADKLRKGYQAQGPIFIPGRLVPPANNGETLESIVAENSSPASEPVPQSEREALMHAMMAIAPGVGLTQASRRGIMQLADMANAGDLDGITNFSCIQNSGSVSTYIEALLEAARSVRNEINNVPIGNGRGPVPEPPVISGLNPNNTALIAAQRKVTALHQAALSESPVAAILAIPTSRGNGYLNRSDDYKTALLAHFGHSIGTEVSHQPAVVEQRQAEPRRPHVLNVPIEQNPSYAVNPDGKTVEQLGFVPRPNVPLDWMVTHGGVRIPGVGLVPWPDEPMTKLAKRYLDQDPGKQQSAKNYQASVSSRLSPMLPALLSYITDRDAAIVRVQQAEEAARRVAMGATRDASADFLRKLEALPDLHVPQAIVGANISSFSGDLAQAARFFKLSEAAVKEIAGRMVADYGTYHDGSAVKFKVEFSASGGDPSLGNGNVKINFYEDGVRISRKFTRETDGTLRVEHCYFSVRKKQLPDGKWVTDNNGGGKALFRTSLGAYMALGVKRVDVHANIDVGGYAWAKFGFKINKTGPGNWNSLRGDILSFGFGNNNSGAPVVTRRADFTYHLAKFAHDISPEALVKLKKILNDPNPNAMFALSDFKDGEVSVGKNLLLLSNWYGTLDLTDPAQKRRCLAYITPR